MSLIEAFIFGLLQGLTEFLPISSSAHLKLAKLFFHIDASDSQVIFDLVCHLGTLLALLHFLRKDILHLLRSDRKKLLQIVLATLPLIPCYFLLKPLRHALSQPQYLGFCLMATATILYISQKKRLKRKRRTRDALWIGAMQSMALIPGISRSASTISCAHILGWEPKEAVRFSFLLSIPTVIGGNCLELLKIYLSQEKVPDVSIAACAVGLMTSLGVGLFVVRLALTYLEKGNLKPFAWYCFGLGIFVTVCLNT